MSLLCPEFPIHKIKDSFVFFSLIEDLGFCPLVSCLTWLQFLHLESFILKTKIICMDTENNLLVMQ